MENNTLKNLSFEEFSRLVSMIRDYNPSNNEISGVHEEREFISKTLNRFFPEMTAVQEVVLSHIVETMDEEEYTHFQNGNPDLYVDPTGKSTPREKKYWEITMESLTKLYEISEGIENHIARQVINAMSLDCLKNKQYCGYVGQKQFFLKKFSDKCSSSRIAIFEEYFKKSYMDKMVAACCLTQFFGYCNEMAKKKKNIDFFIEHFTARLDCLIAESIMGEIKHEKNIEFQKNLESLVKQYFINNEDKG